MEDTLPDHFELPPRGRKRQSNYWLIAAAATAFSAAALLFVLVHNAAREPKRNASHRPANDVEEPAEAADTPEAIAATPDEVPLVDDDGHTPWASPTHGPALDLSYLPPGVEVVLAVRPKSLLKHPEGEKVLAALKPIADAFRDRNAERLLVGWQLAEDGTWQATIVATEAKPASPGDASETEGTGDDGQATVTFDGTEQRVVVRAPQKLMREIRDLAGQSPPLSRDMERLLAHTDASRTVTLIFSPRALFGDDSRAFPGELAVVREPLARFFGESASAAAMSFDWGDNFFAELVAIPTLDMRPETMADTLADRVAALPNQVEDYVLSLEPSAYARRVLGRLPEMVRKLTAYSRHGFDRDAATLRCYLPVTAGHNLLMGTELALAESQGGRAATTQTPAIDATVPIGERLAKRTSLRFRKDTLEAALQNLATDIGVEIIIRGPDLQLDGITKNQSFGIDVADKPASEILVDVLRLANPDKTAAGPDDPKQKLVYVIEPKSPGGPEVVFITTRSQAEKRKEKLPEAFIAR